MRLSTSFVCAVIAGWVLAGTTPARADVSSSETMLQSQFAAANSYWSISKVALIVDQTTDDSSEIITALRALVRAEGWSLIETALPMNSEGNLNQLQLTKTMSDLAKQNPQWLYLGVGQLIDEQRSFIASEAVKHGLPIVAAQDRSVREGHALISVKERVLANGRQDGRSVIINMDVASQLKLFPPLLMMRDAELISRFHGPRQ